VERRFQGCKSSMERKFLEHSLLRSESSTGAKVPWNESSDFSLPGSECSTGAKVLSMVFSLPGTKVQRNEKASYQTDGQVGLAPIRVLRCAFFVLQILRLSVSSKIQQTCTSHVTNTTTAQERLQPRQICLYYNNSKTKNKLCLFN